MKRRASARIHWPAVSLAYSSLFLLGLADNLRGPLYPEVLASLQLSDIQGSYLWACASLFAFFGAVISHQLIVGIGLLGSLQLSLLFMSLGQLGMGMSQGLGFALVSSSIFGLSLGFLGVSQNILVLKAGPAEVISRLQAGLHSNYALSSLLAPLLLTMIYLVSPNWRAGYLGGALFSFLGLIAVCFVKRNRVDGLHQPEEPSGAEENLVVGFQRHFKSAYFALILSFYVLTEIMVSSRLALFLKREAAMDFTQTSLATTGFFVSLFVGRAVLVFWRPALSLKNQLILSLGGTLLFLLLGLFIYPLALLVTGLTMAPFFPLSMAYMNELFGSRVNLVTSWTMSMNSFLVVIMHVLVGAFSDQLGITRALFLGPVAIVCSLLFLIFDKKVLGLR